MKLMSFFPDITVVNVYLRLIALFEFSYLNESTALNNYNIRIYLNRYDYCDRFIVLCPHFFSFFPFPSFFFFFSLSFLIVPWFFLTRWGFVCRRLPRAFVPPTSFAQELAVVLSGSIDRCRDTRACRRNLPDFTSLIHFTFFLEFDDFSTSGKYF